MNLLRDVITYVRRIIKSPSDASISDSLIIDYINRFWLMDVDARIQLFDLKTKYQFQTTPGVDQYNMPLYNVQTEPGSQSIASFPMYQGFTGPAYINGVPVGFYTDRNNFMSYWMNVIQYAQAVAVGNDTAGPYTITFPISPNSVAPTNPPYSAILRGHVDITGIIETGNNVDPIIGNTLNTTVPRANTFPAVWFTSQSNTGANIVVSDSGQFLSSNVNYGLLMVPGASSGNGNTALSGTYDTTSNTVNYLTGVATVTFPSVIPPGVNINAQCQFFQTGLPRAVLFYNNTLTLRAPPALQYLVELDAYLSPAAFLTTSQALPFGYMAEYLARGAARKILSDTGDVEQFQFYEPLFREQEMLVWKRSQRQNTATRTPTIFSGGVGIGAYGSSMGGTY